MPVTPAHFLHLSDEQSAFHAVAAKAWASFALARPEGAERIVGGRVTGRYFEIFGVQPLLGRVFGTPEDEPGRDQVRRPRSRQF